MHCITGKREAPDLQSASLDLHAQDSAGCYTLIDASEMADYKSLQIICMLNIEINNYNV